MIIGPAYHVNMQAEPSFRYLRPTKPEKSKLPQRDQLLLAYHWCGDLGFTDEQAAHRAGLLSSCYWKRCSELRELGYIKQPKGGPVRKGTSGVARVISEITPQGVDHLRELGLLHAATTQDRAGA